MSIKFVCSCGKRLRARDDMASRRSVCPRCGAPIGIPSGLPTVRGGAAGPLSPADRFRTRRTVPHPSSLFPDPVAVEPPPVAPAPGAAPVVAVPAPRPLDPDAVQPPEPVKRRRALFRRRMETRWYHCLAYPFRAIFLVLGLAAALTVLTGATVLLIPELFELRQQPWWHTAVWAGFLLVPFAVAGYACASLDCVLEAGAAGRAAYLAWPGGNVGLALASSGRWFVCFLAGPALLAGVIVAYWLSCGDLLAFDWFVIGELGVVTVGYWLFVVASVAVHGGLIGVHPLRVVDLVHALGYRAAVVTLLGAAVAGAHAALGLSALDGVHRGAAGWLWLFAAWAGGLFCAVFVFRLLGVWCHQARAVPPS